MIKGHSYSIKTSYGIFGLMLTEKDIVEIYYPKPNVFFANKSLQKSFFGALTIKNNIVREADRIVLIELFEKPYKKCK